MVPGIPDAKPLRDKIAKLTTIGPKQKKKRLRRWVRMKTIEEKYALLQKKLDKKMTQKKIIQLRKKREKRMEEYFKKKQEEKLLNKEQRMRQREAQKRILEYQQKINEGAQKLYQNWTKIKENADYERAKKQRQLDTLEQQIRSKFGEKMYQDWLKQQRNNKSVISIALDESKKCLVKNTNPMNTSERIKNKDNLGTSPYIIYKGDPMTRTKSCNIKTYNMEYIDAVNKLRPLSNVLRSTNRVQAVNTKKEQNILIKTKKNPPNPNPREDSEISNESSKKRRQRIDCWWSFGKAE